MAASASSSLECRLVGDWLVVGWLIVSRPAVRSDATTCGPQRERGGLFRDEPRGRGSSGARRHAVGQLINLQPPR